MDQLWLLWVLLFFVGYGVVGYIAARHDLPDNVKSACRENRADGYRRRQIQNRFYNVVLFWPMSYPFYRMNTVIEIGYEKHDPDRIERMNHRIEQLENELRRSA